MAITAIKYVFNLAPRRVRVTNEQSGETSGDMFADQGRSMNTWVPWCTNVREFNPIGPNES